MKEKTQLLTALLEKYNEGRMTDKQEFKIMLLLIQDPELKEVIKDAIERANNYALAQRIVANWLK